MKKNIMTFVVLAAFVLTCVPGMCAMTNHAEESTSPVAQQEKSFLKSKAKAIYSLAASTARTPLFWGLIALVVAKYLEPKPCSFLPGREARECVSHLWGLLGSSCVCRQNTHADITITR